LLSPVPSTQTGEKDPKAVESYSFSGIQNTSRSGLPIPIIYGQVVVGSITISAGATIEDTSGEAGDPDAVIVNA
jgi:predicted phage tail protein